MLREVLLPVAKGHEAQRRPHGDTGGRWARSVDAAPASLEDGAGAVGALGPAINRARAVISLQHFYQEGQRQKQPQHRLCPLLLPVEATNRPKVRARLSFPPQNGEARDARVLRGGEMNVEEMRESARLTADKYPSFEIKKGRNIKSTKNT